MVQLKKHAKITPFTFCFLHNVNVKKTAQQFSQQCVIYWIWILSNTKNLNYKDREHSEGQDNLRGSGLTQLLGGEWVIMIVTSREYKTTHTREAALLF